MKAPLDEFLARVAAIVLRRELAAAGLWALVSIVVALTLASAVVSDTLRGDLGARVAAAAAGLATGLLLARALRRSATAGGLEASGGPYHSPKSTTAHAQDRYFEPPPRLWVRPTFRCAREILGAVELAPSVHDPKDPHANRPTGLFKAPTVYVQTVEGRLRECEPELAAPPPRQRAPAIVLALFSLAAAVLSGTAGFTRGLTLVLSATDGRPPRPPEAPVVRPAAHPRRATPRSQTRTRAHEPQR